MVKSIFEFYKKIVPFGDAVRASGKWSNGATTNIDLEADAANTVFAREVTFAMSDDFAFTGTITITDGVTKSNISITTVEELLAYCTEVRPLAVPTGTNRIWGTIEFSPPLYAAKADGLKITVGGSPTISAGTISLVINGWQILDSELEETSS